MQLFGGWASRNQKRLAASSMLNESGKWSSDAIEATSDSARPRRTRPERQKPSLVFVSEVKGRP